VAKLGLETNIVDQKVLENTVARFAEAGIILPTFAQLQDPQQIPQPIVDALADVDPQNPHPLNLFRVHWFNSKDGKNRAALPQYLVLPSALTGVPARIVVAIGRNFPMIRAHKVLAAYGCLAPRLVTGQFDPTSHRAIWPSTGNYCRGGVAISRIMECRGVAILPELMSRERFDWLKAWVSDPDADIHATPGSESNVKEIYDKCAELEKDEHNVVFNQFCEFGNHLVHYAATGRMLEQLFLALQKESPELSLSAYVSASGSAGTLAAGDYLKQHLGSKTVVVEALECPTLLYNGFGEHNIQGIGDKHIPLIHNAMQTDIVVGVSERATDRLALLFNHPVGKRFFAERKGLENELIAKLGWLGLSAICNVLAAIKTAKHLDYGKNDVVMTVATDGMELYETELEKSRQRYFGESFDLVDAAEIFGEHLGAVSTDHLQELDQNGKARIFNLGYYTWVEQQGVSIEQFEARRKQSFWRELQSLPAAWDALIDELNQKTGLLKKVYGI
jgi:cysteine synthase A